MTILYVDNFIILANNVNQSKWLKLELEIEFGMSELKKLYYCLEVEFERNKEAHTNTINQMSYIKEVLKRFNIEECKTSWNSIRCEFKVVKVFGWGIWECVKENERYSIKGWGKISHRCNSEYESLSCICSEYGEPIHVEGQSTALDACETHHEVFEGHFGLQIMPQKQGYCFKRILRCGLGGRCKRLAIHHVVCVSCWHWIDFMEMQETTNHCIVSDIGGVHGH